MNSTFTKASLSLLLCGALMTSCVSSKKYDELKASKEALEREQAASRDKEKELSGTLKQREQRLAELERAMNEQKKVLDDLRNEVNTALSGFNQGDLSVSMRDGKVYVSMSDKLLFATGSTKVNNTGRQALDQLVRDYEKVRYNAIGEYGGWGIRWSGKGKAYSMSGSEGVRLHFYNKEPLLIGSQRVTELFLAIEQGKVLGKSIAGQV